MKKRLFVLMLCLVLINTLFSVTACADTGPKPSVQIDFINMDDEECYGTLLSYRDGTGPASAWDGTEEGIRCWDETRDIWEAFVNFKDTDGYYYLQQHWDVGETKSLNWTYYPPDPFKILLYYPKTGEYVVSGIYERYAFDSYFTVDMSGKDNADFVLTAVKSYNLTGEVLSFFCRVILTIFIEIVIALIFGFRTKKQLILILLTNALTQVILNILVSIIGFNEGEYVFVAFYFLFEIIVFAIEGAVYSVMLKRYTEKPVGRIKPVLYALVANFASFIAGVFIERIIPEMF
ncbi:MAG: hypothetical protein J6B08_02130 [Ruminiclostridium sp.]|nr:hypothetical protein [Ruminiclostridium sp.]